MALLKGRRALNLWEEISKLDLLSFNGVVLLEALKNKRLVLIIDMESLLRYEEIFWKQKAKENGLKKETAISDSFIDSQMVGNKRI